MQVPERMAGRTGKCPGCGHLVKIPAASADAAPPAVPGQAAAAPWTAGGASCKEHNGKPVGKCGTCGAPICIECRKAFGYFCGPACRDTARERKPEVTEDHKASDRSAVAKADALLAKSRKILMIAGLGVAALLVIWILLALRGQVDWEIQDAKHTFMSAVSDGKQVYALTGDGKVASIAPRSGDIRWTADVGDGASSERSFFSWRVRLRPAAGRLLCIQGGTITALDAATGKKAWKHEAPSSGRFSWTRLKDPGLAASGKAIILARGKTVVCLDPASGKARWTAAKEEFEPGVVALRGGRVYAAGRPGTVMCLGAADGKVIWTWTMDAISAKGAPRGLARLLPVDDGVVAATARLAFRLDAKGALRWSSESGPYEEDLHGTDLAMVGKRIFFAGHYRGVLLDPDSGKVLWRVQIGNDPRFEWTDGGALLVSSSGPPTPDLKKIDGGVAGTARYAGTLRGGVSMGMSRTMALLDADSGKSRWFHPAGRHIFAGDGYAYTSGQEGKVALLEPNLESMFKSQLFALAVDMDSGEQAWRWDRMHTEGNAVLTDSHLLILGSVRGEKKKDPPVGFVLALDR
jgi:outer membrane protein assembly factor BamB